MGFLAGGRRKMDLEQWTVAGRGFGLVLIWLLMAGEVYTTFSFLGASGWAYSRGGPTLYILAYLTLAYVVSFYILPPIWESGPANTACRPSPISSACVTAAGLWPLCRLRGRGLPHSLSPIAAYGTGHHRRGGEFRLASGARPPW